MEEEFLNDIGRFLVEQIQQEIVRKRPRFALSPKTPKGNYNANASGKLYASVAYKVRDGEIDIIMEDYGADYLFGRGSWPGGGKYYPDKRPAQSRGATSGLITELTKWAQVKLGLPPAKAKSMAFATRKNLFKSGYSPIPLFDQQFQEAIYDRANELLQNPEYAQALANGLLDNIFDRINLFGKETYEITFG
jgi:hypothetical protein